MPPHEQEKEKDTKGETDSLVQTSSVSLQPRVPGLLRFLPDQLSCYPYDALQPWTSRNQRRRQRRASKECRIIDKKMVNLLDHVRTVVVVFCFDAQQPHSVRLRNSLVELLSTRRELMLVVAVSSVLGDNKSIICSHDHDQDLESTSPCATSFVDPFLQGTGFLLTPLTPTLQASFNVTQVPSLVVVTGGRKISSAHEELALEWNEPDEIVAQWTRGESALSTRQQVQASVLFPQCIVM